MGLLAGTTLGSYKIVGLLGAGGMAEVYKAHDSRLNRVVAIKVLPSYISEQPDLRQRFEIEARAIAAFNHPHICIIHDVGRQDGLDYLVMEYLDGETLEARLSRGPLPLDQVLRYATEIASALDKAHRHGVVHRDLKPGNIMLTAAGSKLFDFGLAKLNQPAAAFASNSILPTNDRLTAAGTILGTLQYMAPEQLEGKDADARTDIFAFGSTVYEMATGKKAFEGKSQVSLMAAILEHEAPRISVLQPVAPKLLDNVVRKCLEKDPNNRWQTAEALMDALKWLNDVQSEKALDVAAPPRRRRFAAASVVAIVVFTLLGIGLGSRFAKTVQPSTPPIQFSLSAPNGQDLQPNVSVSPDGRWLTFETGSGGNTTVWLRPTDSAEARELPGAHGAGQMFWSPDSKQLAFFADRKLKTTDVGTGLTRILTDVPIGGIGNGGAWSRDGVILFGCATGLYKVASGGGVATRVDLKDGAEQAAQRLTPRFLPDGEHFLYTIPKIGPIPLDGNSQLSVKVGSLKSLEAQSLLEAESAAQFVLPGYILFLNNRTLWAQLFDSGRLTLIGDPQPVAQPIAERATGAFSASQNGVLLFKHENADNSELIWVDPKGKEIGKLKKPPTGTYANPSLSPDGLRVAVNSTDPRTHNTDIWIVDNARDVAERFTLGGGSNSDSVWSPDGGQIAFASRRDGHSGLYLKTLSGSATEQLIAEVGGNPIPTDWSPDEQFIVYSTGVGAGNYRLWLLSLPDHKSKRLLPALEFGQYGARFSHDGKWIAYASNESGRFEIYIHSFPDLTRRHQISDAGGTHPRWGKQDGEIYYHNGTDSGLEVAVLRKSGSDLMPETPHKAFDRPVPDQLDGRNHYTVTADGQRFLVRQETAGASIPSLTVIVDWLATLHQ